jgi:putative transposase
LILYLYYFIIWSGVVISIVYKSNAHCKFRLKAHLIFVVKYRKPLLDGTVGDQMKDVLLTLQTSEFTIDMLEVDKNHVHLLVDYVPRISIEQIVRKLKQESTARIWEKVDLKRYFWKKNVFWSSGYFACSTGDASTEVIRRYIEQQG